MGDISNETSMEDILSSIKRIIAEEGESAVAQTPRTRKPARPAPESVRPMSPPPAVYEDEDDGVLDLDGFPAPPPPAARTRAPVSAPEPVAPAAATPTADPILSDRAAAASSRSLESLAKLVVRPEAPGSDTLEGLVRELLRPMLREWLDEHLPEIVETMVAREISRITGAR